MGHLRLVGRRGQDVVSHPCGPPGLGTARLTHLWSGFNPIIYKYFWLLPACTTTKFRRGDGTETGRRRAKERRARLSMVHRQTTPQQQRRHNVRSFFFSPGTASARVRVRALCRHTASRERMVATGHSGALAGPPLPPPLLDKAKISRLRWEKGRHTSAPSATATTRDTRRLIVEKPRRWLFDRQVSSQAAAGRPHTSCHPCHIRLDPAGRWHLHISAGDIETVQ